jgi:hypothetical protein
VLGEEAKGKSTTKEVFCREWKGTSGVDDLSSKLETRFFMVSCLSSNMVFGVGWYVDSGGSKQTYDL